MIKIVHSVQVVMAGVERVSEDGRVAVDGQKLAMEGMLGVAGDGHG